MPQNPPYFPPREVDQGDWSNNFNTLLTASPTTYGLVAGDALAVDAVVDAFLAALALATNPATRTAVTVAAKDSAKAAMAAVVFPLATRIARNSAVTNGNKTAIGVTVPITTRTRNPVTANEIELNARYTVEGAPIVVASDPATPTTKKRPLGALTWELQIESAATVAGPWSLNRDVQVSRPQVILNPTEFDLTKVFQMRARWVGALLPGGTPNLGPWSAFTPLEF